MKYARRVSCSLTRTSFRFVRRALSLQEKLPGTFLRLVAKVLGSGRVVLDAGCGTGQFQQSLTKLTRAAIVVGIDAHLPSLHAAKKRRIYQDVVCGDVVRMPFRAKSFEIALCVEVIEHLRKEDGLKLITNLEEVASSRVVLTTPNGFTQYLPFLNTESSKQSVFLRHRSGWVPEDFVGRGYSVSGSGLSLVWGENGLIRKAPIILQLVLAGISYVLNPLASHAPHISAKIVCCRDTAPEEQKSFVGTTGDQSGLSRVVA